MIRINYISWFSGGIATDLPPLQTYNTRMCKAVKSELLKILDFIGYLRMYKAVQGFKNRTLNKVCM